MQMDYRIWCWEAAQAGHGPDWRFFAQVAPEGEADLAKIAASAELPGYAYCGLNEAYCWHHGQACLMHTFMDSSSAAAYTSNVTGGRQTNLWVYNAVEIHGTIVELECGYGGRGDTHNQAETAFLLDLFARPEIVLQRWAVYAGGDGYDFRTIAEGAGVETLRSYLGPSSP